MWESWKNLFIDIVDKYAALEKYWFPEWTLPVDYTWIDSQNLVTKLYEENCYSI